MTQLISRRKHIYASIDMAVDFTNRLASGETLASNPVAVVVSSTHGSNSDITVGTATISGNTVTARIGGGTALKHVDEDLWETEYTLRFEVVTSSGETESEVVELVTYESIGTGS